jgi:AraC-like DNA-binding protein
LLGYEDPNSFFRAFRTWTGQTPDDVRMKSG